MKKVVVIDGQGGKLGKQVIEMLREKNSNIKITAIGTNAMATQAMMKAGADEAATGENPVIVASRTADIIIGPIGIVVADSLLGEVTPNMAIAIGQSNAKKLLIPINKCNNVVLGIPNITMSNVLEQILKEIDND